MLEERTLITCPTCGSMHVWKAGYRIVETNPPASGIKKQRYQCQHCGFTFSEDTWSYWELKRIAERLRTKSVSFSKIL